jgi:dipeptidyl aminopeptidase/acylaminoacyl peptidase
VRGEKDADLAAVSPLQQQARLTVPVLIAHGERDTNVPPAQGHQLVAALEKRKADVQSVFYPEDGHGLTKRKDLIDFLGRLDAFLRKNNPA